jgi:hypothetical protein
MSFNLLRCVIFVVSAAMRVNSFQIGTISACLLTNERQARSSWRVSATIADTVLDDETLDRGATRQEEAFASVAKQPRFMPAMIKRVKKIPGSVMAGCGVGLFVARSALVKTWSRSRTALVAVLFLMAAFLRKQTSGSSSSFSDATVKSALGVNEEESNGERDNAASDSEPGGAARKASRSYYFDHGWFSADLQPRGCSRDSEEPRPNC